jgi:hypothetical protein
MKICALLRYSLALQPFLGLLALLVYLASMLSGSLACGEGRAIDLRKEIGKATCFTFLPDDKSLAVGTETGMVCVLQPGEKTPFVYKAHSGSVDFLLSAPDQKTILSCGNDKTIRFYDHQKRVTNRVIRTTTDSFHTVEISPNGKMLAWTENPKHNKLWLCDLTTGKITESGSGDICCFQFSPDNSHLYLGMNRDKLLGRHWHHYGALATLHLGRNSQKTKAHTSRIETMRCFGSIIILSGGTQSDIRFRRNVAFVGLPSCCSTSESPTDPESIVLEDERACDPSLLLSPDGRIITSQYEKGQVVLWECITGLKIKECAMGTAHLLRVAVSPQGQFLAGLTPDGVVHVRPLISDREEVINAEKLWTDLGDVSAPVAYRAVCQLSVHPKQAVRLIKKHLPAIPPTSPTGIAAMISKLDHPTYHVREKATIALAALGLEAQVELRKALAQPGSLEFKYRIKRLLLPCPEWVVKDPWYLLLESDIQMLREFRADLSSEIKQSNKHLWLPRLPEWLAKNGKTLQTVRGIWILQNIGTPEARAHLEELAKGPPPLRQTIEAQAALQYLKRFDVK